MKWELKQKTPTPEVALKWQESGVAVAGPPKRSGYGRELIERALPYQLNAKTKLDFGSDGARCEIVVPVLMEPIDG